MLHAIVLKFIFVGYYALFPLPYVPQRQQASGNKQEQSTGSHNFLYFHNLPFTDMGQPLGMNYHAGLAQTDRCYFGELDQAMFPVHLERSDDDLRIPPC